MVPSAYQQAAVCQWRLVLSLLWSREGLLKWHLSAQWKMEMTPVSTIKTRNGTCLHKENENGTYLHNQQESTCFHDKNTTDTLTVPSRIWGPQLFWHWEAAGTLCPKPVWWTQLHLQVTNLTVREVKSQLVLGDRGAKLLYISQLLVESMTQQMCGSVIAHTAFSTVLK